MKKLKQRKGIAALITLAAVLLFLGGDLVWLGKTHVGFGWWQFGGYAPEPMAGAPERSELLAESEYKRYCYTGGAMLLLFGGVTLSGVVVAWKKQNKLEELWERTISNPQNVQDIRQHSEFYRDDFMAWIKENHPNLLLRKGDESG